MPLPQEKSSTSEVRRSLRETEFAEAKPMSVIVDFSMYPLDKGESLSPYVARSIRIIQESGLPYEFRSMGTSIEGEWEEVMAVVNRCFETMRQDCNRVVLALKADYRKGPSGRMQRKIESVQEKL
jgi:uncharacterized protein (TIGR00106 family)